MKIAIAKSLAEPLTISWEAITTNHDIKVRDEIMEALQRYIDVGHDPATPQSVMSRMLRCLARAYGGFDIRSKCIPITHQKKSIGIQYWIYFKASPGGPEYIRIYIADTRRPAIF